MSYFVSILSRVKNIFLLGCQVFFLDKPRFRCIFESHRSPIQKRNSLIDIKIECIMHFVIKKLI